MEKVVLPLHFYGYLFAYSFSLSFHGKSERRERKSVTFPVLVVNDSHSSQPPKLSFPSFTNLMGDSQLVFVEVVLTPESEPVFRCCMSL